MAKKQSATRRLLKIVIGLIILLVLLGIIGSITGLFGGGEAGVPVETAEAREHDLTQVVTAFGRVQPEVEVSISPDVSGEIIELPIEEGDHVEEGELLVVLEPDFYVAQVEQAEAGVKQAKANLAQSQADLLRAESKFKRQRALYERNVIAESALEEAQTAYKVAQASYEASEYQVEIAEAKLREAREQLSKTRIYAPMTGTISMLEVEVGERVVGTSQMAGTEMMRVALLDQMEIEVDVNENDVVNVALGDTATIDIDAFPERAFEGVVTEIANSARVNNEGTQQQVTSFPVKVRIVGVASEETSGEEASGAEQQQGQQQGLAHAEEVPQATVSAPVLRPGMTGTVEIFTATVQHAVSVPIQAVTVRDFNQVHPDSSEQGSPSPSAFGPREEDLRRVVFVVDSTGQAKMVQVETGISNDLFIEVKSGLAGGEDVIIGPYEAVSRTLRPGMNVNAESARSTASVQ